MSKRCSTRQRGGREPVFGDREPLDAIQKETRFSGRGAKAIFRKAAQRSGKDEAEQKQDLGQYLESITNPDPRSRSIPNYVQELLDIWRRERAGRAAGRQRSRWAHSP